MRFEVEFKFPVADLGQLRERLEGLAAQFHEPLEQVDLYLKHPARDFARTDEALRLRSTRSPSSAQCVITYKGPKIDPHSKTRREIELPLVDDGRWIEAWRELLEALGFQSVAEVRKRREPATIKWHGQTVEAALDDVTGVGHFVELEIAADEQHVETAKKSLADLAQSLGLSGSERRSYLELLLGHREPPSAV